MAAYLRNRMPPEERRLLRLAQQIESQAKYPICDCVGEMTTHTIHSVEKVSYFRTYNHAFNCYFSPHRVEFRCRPKPLRERTLIYEHDNIAHALRFKVFAVLCKKVDLHRCGHICEYLFPSQCFRPDISNIGFEHIIDRPYIPLETFKPWRVIDKRSARH